MTVLRRVRSARRTDAGAWSVPWSPFGSPRDAAGRPLVFREGETRIVALAQQPLLLTLDGPIAEG